MKKFFILYLLTLMLFCTCPSVTSMAENNANIPFQTLVTIEATYINTTATMTAHFTVNPNAGVKHANGQWEFDNDVWGEQQRLIVFNETGAPVSYNFYNISTISTNAPYQRIAWKTINYKNDLDWANMGFGDTRKYYSFGVNGNDIDFLASSSLLASKFDTEENRSSVQYLEFRCGLSWVEKTTLIYNLILSIELAEDTFIPADND